MRYKIKHMLSNCMHIKFKAHAQHARSIIKSILSIAEKRSCPCNIKDMPSMSSIQFLQKYIKTKRQSLQKLKKLKFFVHPVLKWSTQIGFDGVKKFGVEILMPGTPLSDYPV
jgi:hypothetical protein